MVAWSVTGRRILRCSVVLCFSFFGGFILFPCLLVASQAFGVSSVWLLHCGGAFPFLFLLLLMLFPFSGGGWILIVLPGNSLTRSLGPFCFSAFFGPIRYYRFICIITCIIFTRTFFIFISTITLLIIIGYITVYLVVKSNQIFSFAFKIIYWLQKM